MTFALPEMDGRGHMRGCPRYNPGAPLADEDTHDMDFFCECHDWEEPKVLTQDSIAWPKGWSRAQALAWRAKNGIAAPAPI
jgi:hypothetical protein